MKRVGLQQTSRKMVAVSIGAALAIAGTTAWFVLGAVAQNTPEAGGDAAKKRKPKVVAPAPATTPPANAAAPQGANDFAARLTGEGAGTCVSQLNTMAQATMGGVAQFNTSVSWAKSGQDRRLVTLAIGQKYPSGAVPQALTALVAAPSPAGGCDGVSTQVLPSPLACAAIAGGMASKGARQVGDLAGVTMLQDATGTTTMLVPTAANTCVLVGTKLVYANEARPQ